MRTELQHENAPKKSGWRYWIGALLLFWGAMLVPALAVQKLISEMGVKAVAVYFGTVSLMTMFVFKFDKVQAEHQLWRVRERTLHFLELIGGWGGGFLAQRIFRHKISKTSYQRAFWLVAVIHHLVAIDYLRDWKVSILLYKTVKPYVSEYLSAIG